MCSKSSSGNAESGKESVKCNDTKRVKKQNKTKNKEQRMYLITTNPAY